MCPTNDKDAFTQPRILTKRTPLVESPGNASWSASDAHIPLSLNSSLLEGPCAARPRVESTPCGLLEVSSPKKNAPDHVQAVMNTVSFSLVRSKVLTGTAGSSRSSHIEQSSFVYSESRQLTARPNRPCHSFLNSECSPGNLITARCCRFFDASGSRGQLYLVNASCGSGQSGRVRICGGVGPPSWSQLPEAGDCGAFNDWSEHRRRPSSKARVPLTAPSHSYCVDRMLCASISLLRNAPGQPDSAWERGSKAA